MTESTQHEPSDDSIDEPDFGPPDDPEAEASALAEIAARNRRRILIPLAVLLTLFFVLSFFDPPPGESPPDPVQSGEEKIP